MGRSMKVLISGAGVVGLLTAQALKARNIDFEIFDRDADVKFRENAGWAITLHWALDTILGLVPPELAQEVYNAQVRPNFHLHDTGRFKYINATNGNTILSVPPAKRLRVRREQIRRILLKGIDVNWNCYLTEITERSDGITVTCASGKTFEGDVLLGCDGSNSAVRKILCGEEQGRLNQLPLRFCGAKVQLSGEEMENIATRFDPLYFQGTTPTNETFIFFSTLATPAYTNEDDVYYAQVNLSWKVGDAEEPFKTSEDKAAALLKHASDLHPELHDLVVRATRDPQKLVEIKLADWSHVQWDTRNYRIMLLGDAAHAMTMYRANAANHGIADVADLMKQIDQYQAGAISWDEAVTNYCKIMRARAREAVLLSRQACMDAHEFSKIRSDSDSPLLWLDY